MGGFPALAPCLTRRCRPGSTSHAAGPALRLPAGPRPSWTACPTHPTRRPGSPSPIGSSPASHAAGPGSASPPCAAADNSATSLHPPYRWGLPAPVQYFRCRLIEAHEQGQPAGWGRQPVRLSSGTGAVMPDEQVERAVSRASAHHPPLSPRASIVLAPEPRDAARTGSSPGRMSLDPAVDR
jgi:hypothetical protein